MRVGEREAEGCDRPLILGTEREDGTIPLGQLTKLRSHWATEYEADCHLLHTGPSSMTPTPRLEIPQLLVSKVTSSHLLPKSRCL